jgi:dipeptidyl aminopeptidase/acylaminoacyl peptidase
VTPVEIPYGRWPSPISADSAAAAAAPVDEVRFADGELLWLEGQGGRTALVGWSEVGGRREVSPPGADVGSNVYGYGGGAWAAGGGSVWFCDQRDGRIWRTAPGRSPAPVTRPDDGPVRSRYADLHAAAGGGQVVCVREREENRETTTDIVSVGADGRPRVLAAGADFHAHPRLDRTGHRLAWLTWSDPLLPWDGTWLWTADVREPGQAPVRVAGGAEESVLQPAWGPDGGLYFLSDRSGWWNLYRWHAGRVGPVVTAEAEMAAAPWELGYATYAVLPAGRIAVLLQNGPRCRLTVCNPASDRTEDVPLAYTSIKPYLTADGSRVGLIGSNPAQAPTVAIVDTETGAVREITTPPPLADVRYLSTPEPVAVPTRDGRAAHGLFYPPTNPDVTPAGGRPPLIVRPHPGPTSGVTVRLDPAVQFFTSRGIAVLDLDYRGSTGYGRAYRQALDGQWGILDVTDCVDAADYLAATGRTDSERVAISGASAGGYTALRALATTTRFDAGTARAAIADPAAWRAAVPRFQRHHTTDLIGPWPQAAPTYRERSALHDPHRITAPVLLVHGDQDQIAPAAAIQDLADRLHAAGTRCTLLLQPGEGHPPRSPTAVAAALDAELALYRDSLTF